MLRNAPESRGLHGDVDVTAGPLAHSYKANTPEEALLTQLEGTSGEKEAPGAGGRLHVCAKHKEV